MSDFALAAGLFHLALAVLFVSRVRRWWARGAGLGAGAYAGSLAGDLAVLGVGALALGVPAAALGSRQPLFALARLLCQALFGEGLLLAGVVGALHARRGQWWRALPPAALAFALLGVYADAYHVEPRRLEVRRHALRLPGATAASPHLRIAHLSDLQTPAIGAHERRAVRAAMDGAPDLVLLTGDYLQGRGALAAGARADFRALLRELHAPLGVYAVPGDVEPDCRLFRGTHVVCLQDEARVLDLGDGERLALLGLSTHTSRNGSRPALRALLAGLDGVRLRLAMGHAPDFAQALEPGQVDLALAGHTHGGQVVLPGIGPLVTLSRLPRRYAGGLHELHGVPLNVSRGVGMERGVAPQVRFLCPPELSLIDLSWPGSDRAAPARAAGG